ncbi:hypothetical protein ACKFKG_32665 [Phormidesmis sp. 146-35]
MSRRRLSLSLSLSIALNFLFWTLLILYYWFPGYELRGRYSGLLLLLLTLAASLWAVLQTVTLSKSRALRAIVLIPSALSIPLLAFLTLWLLFVLQFREPCLTVSTSPSGRHSVTVESWCFPLDGGCHTYVYLNQAIFSKEIKGIYTSERVCQLKDATIVQWSADESRIDLSNSLIKQTIELPDSSRS